MLFNLLMYTRKLRNKAYFDISKFTKYIIEGSGESEANFYDHCLEQL